MAEQHTLKRFDEELERLSATISEMGGLAEAQFAQSLVALRDGDTEVAEQVIADDAKNTAKRSIVLAASVAPAAAVAGIDRLGRQVRTALKDVLDAFAHDDVAKAHDVWQRDEEIDQVYTGLFRELLTYMMEDPRNITACTHLLFMAKNIERAGDHVTNIAELVSFRITGQVFDEARPKGSASLYAAGSPR